MITKITFWCQKVLPVEFDDSLSYYETLCKVVEKLNEVVDTTNKAFNQLETDVNAELNKKQDTLVSGENIKTVNGQSILGSGNVEIDTGIDVEGNPVGDATDGNLIKIKIGSKIYSIHDYTEAINSKLDKKTNISTYDQTYIKLASGGQTMINITPALINISAIMRDANGRASIATPTSNLHIANKGYVDETISGKQDTLVSGTNIKTVNGQNILGSGNISIETGGTEVEGNPTGNATDGDLVKIKIGSKIYSIHDYTDAINGKLDKVTGTTNYNQVYSKAPNGAQQVLNATPQSSSNALILRDTNGRANIEIPNSDNNIANKRYVDEAVKDKQDTLVSGTNIKTINGNSVLGSGNISIATGTVVEGNPTADATDGDLTKIKIDSKIFSIHDYTSAINGKLNKDTRNSNYDQVYGKRTNGTQSMINISNSLATNSLIIRDSNNRAYIAIPTEDNHIANKYYVDDAVSGKQDTLVSGTNIKTINGNSILGSGDINIGGGTGGVFNVVDLPWENTFYSLNLLNESVIYNFTNGVTGGLIIDNTKDIECVIIAPSFPTAGLQLYWEYANAQQTDITYRFISSLPFTLNEESTQEGETAYFSYLKVTEVKPIYIQQKYDATAKILTAMVFQL